MDVIYFKQLFLFFALAQKAKFGFFRLNFDLYSSSLLFPLGFAFRACTFGWLSFQERDKFNYSAKSSTVGKKKEGEVFFPKCYMLFACNSVRIGQNVLNEVLLERSILTDTANYSAIP